MEDARSRLVGWDELAEIDWGALLVRPGVTPGRFICIQTRRTDGDWFLKRYLGLDKAPQECDSNPMSETDLLTRIEALERVAADLRDELTTKDEEIEDLKTRVQDLELAR